jgi:hypothetical protein
MKKKRGEKYHPYKWKQEKINKKEVARGVLLTVEWKREWRQKKKKKRGDNINVF